MEDRQFMAKVNEWSIDLSKLYQNFQLITSPLKQFLLVTQSMLQLKQTQQSDPSSRSTNKRCLKGEPRSAQERRSLIIHVQRNALMQNRQPQPQPLSNPLAGANVFSTSGCCHGPEPTWNLESQLPRAFGNHSTDQRWTSHKGCLTFLCIGLTKARDSNHSCYMNATFALWLGDFIQGHTHDTR